jgi:glycine/sarcosine N-methyltransferase
MALYTNIAELYDEIFPLKQTRLNFISSFLKDNSRVLDIGCATGELVLALSAEGHDVVGIDLDEKMIAMAREKAKKQGLNPLFFVQDMTQIGTEFSPGFFDTIICFGNTLVHLENQEKINNVVNDVNKVLKKDGIFLIQIVNYQRILSGGIKELPLLENKNFIFRREYAYNESDHVIRFLTQLTIKKNGGDIKSNEILLPLTFKELRNTLLTARFSHLQFFGDESKMPCDKNSPALIIAAEKIDH